MNQLEALQQLYVKTKTITLPKKLKEGQRPIVLEMSPLALDDLALFSKATGKDISPEESSKMMLTVLAKSLDCTEQDLGKVSMEYMFDLTDYLMEMNNMGDEDKENTSKIKEFMKQKQDITPPKSSEINSIQ